jgi:hypothetical protein
MSFAHWLPLKCGFDAETFLYTIIVPEDHSYGHRCLLQKRCIWELPFTVYSAETVIYRWRFWKLNVFFRHWEFPIGTFTSLWTPANVSLFPSICRHKVTPNRVTLMKLVVESSARICFKLCINWEQDQRTFLRALLNKCLSEWKVLQMKPGTKDKAHIVNPVNLSVSFILPKVVKCERGSARESQ